MDKRFYWSNTCYVTAVSNTTFMLFMVLYSAKMLSNVVKHCWNMSERVVESLYIFCLRFVATLDYNFASAFLLVLIVVISAAVCLYVPSY